MIRAGHDLWRSWKSLSLAWLCLLLLAMPFGSPANSQTPGEAIEIARPPAAATLFVEVPANAKLIFRFDVSDVGAERAGQDLLFLFPDGGRLVLRNLFAEAQLASVRLLIGGTEIPAEKLFELVAPQEGSELEESEVTAAAGDDDYEPPIISGLRHTGRDLLFPGEDERDGHPLYSYLLFTGASEGTREERKRFRSAIEAFVGQVRLADELESRGAARGEINIFYAPLLPIFEETTPESMRIHFAQRSKSEQIALLEELYDHARAEVLIGKMQLIGNGPFIVSVLKPLSRNMNRESDPFLVQDLSRVPPELVALWVDEFKRQVVQEATETPEHLRRLALNLRTKIAVLAEAFAITKSAAAEMFETPTEASSDGN